MRTHSNPLGRGLAQVYFQRKGPTVFGKKPEPRADPFGSSSNLCLGSSKFLLVCPDCRLHSAYTTLFLHPAITF